MVSVIGDVYREKWRPLESYTWPPPSVSKLEFDALKREVEELKKLLAAAKKFDEATGQPDCEMDDKIGLLRKVAKAVGVNLDDILIPSTGPP